MEQWNDLIIGLKAEFKRRVFEESMVRIQKCLQELSEEQIWHRPNAQLSSIGNLILHVCGNAKQWICSGIAGQPDFRERSKEFETDQQLSKSELMELLNKTKTQLDTCVEVLDANDLLRKRKVQVFDEHPLSVLIHVIEHFSYHTGQITWQTKLFTERDLKYYGDINLEKE